MLKLIGIPVTAFIVCALIGPVLIPYLHKLKFGQSIRECGPASHMAKSGTPTMGGLMMLAALLVALLWGNFTPHVIIALVLTCLLYTSPSPRDRQKSRMPSSA